MDVLLRRLWRSAFRRGLAGEGWQWLAVGGAAYAFHRARRRPPDVIESFTLGVGESVTLLLREPPPGRAARRRARRAGRGADAVPDGTDEA